MTADQFLTVDWMNHQSSLNGFQARRDADGKFRAVIARRDPHAPNWLDTGGRRRGFIVIRWLDNPEAPTVVPTDRCRTC